MESVALCCDDSVELLTNVAMAGLHGAGRCAGDLGPTADVAVRAMEGVLLLVFFNGKLWKIDADCWSSYMAFWLHGFLGGGVFTFF